MPEYRRASTKGGTYFFTVNTYRRQPVLIDEDVRDALREGIDKTREVMPFQILAWYCFRITCTASGCCLKAMRILQNAGA